MFALTKLSANSRQFVNTLVNTGSGRSRIASITLARAIADVIGATPTVGANAEDMFRATLEIQVRQLISKVNELALVDTDNILRYTKQFYLWKAYVLCGQRTMFNTKKESAVIDFFGIGNYFDQESLTALADDPLKNTNYYNGFRALLAEFFETKAGE